LHCVSFFFQLFFFLSKFFLFSVDFLLSLLFNLLHIILPQAGWSCCFCGGIQEDGTCPGTIHKNNTFTMCSPAIYAWQTQFQAGSGILPALSYVIQAVLVAVVGFIRKFPLSCYWSPYGKAPSNISETWIFSFLGPTADALSIATGNLMCFAESIFLLPRICLFRGERFLGSVVRWAAELIFRVVGFIEAFVEQFIDMPYTCTGPTCDSSGNQQSALNIDQKPLGNMLVILFSFPVDLLIGDSGVACTSICPPINAVPTPQPCDCWNLSPNTNSGTNYGGGSALLPYSWTTNSSQCLNANGIHVGTPYLDTSGCCIILNLQSFGGLTHPLPICQSIDDISPASSAYPGSCVALTACRPDSLPSIANDPLTPPGLSIAYKGAVDGLIMGLLRYLRCLLGNVLGCDSQGRNCIDFGIIFYPALLVFSITWQILGGVIRFIVACILFLLSLFSPPNGNGCECYESSVMDGYGQIGVRYQGNVNGLCYPCITPRVQCDNPVSYPGYTPTCVPLDPPICENPGGCFFMNQCRPYCPVWQLFNNPTWTQQQAYQQCLVDYDAYKQKQNPWLQKVYPLQAQAPGDIAMTADVICSGHKPNTTLTEITALGAPYVTTVWPAFTQTTSTTGACLPPNVGQTPFSFYMLLDMCPDPNCQRPNATVTATCGTNPSSAIGLWPCLGADGPFDRIYPDCPCQVPCGVIAVIQNLLAVFASFVAIFTQPIMIPSSQSIGKKKDEVNPVKAVKNLYDIMTARSTERFVGPVRRESWQTFEARFSGVIYGQTGDGPSFVESIVTALYDYDTSDCYTDPVMCACRNLKMPHTCIVTPQGELVNMRKRGEPLSAEQVMEVTGTEVFNGETVCDLVHRNAVGQTWNRTLSKSFTHQWIRCLDERVRGQRLNVINDVFPEDFIHNPHSPVTLIQNMFHKAKRVVVKQMQEKRQEEKKYRSPAQEMNDRFPNFFQQLRNRTVQVRDALIRHGLRPSSIMFDAIIRADSIYYKYESGYYGFALSKAAEALTRGGVTGLPTKEETIREMKFAADDLRRVLWHQPYKQVVTATVEATTLTLRHAGAILEEGVVNFARRNYHEFIARRTEHFARRNKPAFDARSSRFMDALQRSPIYQWYKGEEGSSKRQEGQSQGLFRPFADHMARVIAFQRQHWRDASLNFWNADLKFWSASDILLKRWRHPVWTDEKRRNWERAQGVYYRTYNQIWPGHLSPEIEKRFLFGSNCVLIDRVVNITLKTVEFCLLAAAPNTGNTKRRDQLVDYANNVAFYRERGYYGYKNRHKFVERRYIENDPNSYIRPKWIGEVKPKPNVTIRDVPMRTYQHAMRSSFVQYDVGPSGWNFYYWLLWLVETISEFALGSAAVSWWDAARVWLLNPNTSELDWPDVGLLYWIEFPFLCKFPQNLDCSIGTGLGTALFWVTIAFAGVTIVGTEIFPPLALPIEVIGFTTAYFAVLAAVAWHYSPRCLFIFPSFPIPFGVALPMCLMDEVIAFFDKWITNCYSPLIIPPYMISGTLCPTDPNQQIDFINCAQVGVSDGITNVLFWGFWIIGSGFASAVRNICTSVVATWIPGFPQYIATTMDSFQYTNPTNFQRMIFCSFWTLPALAGPYLFCLVAGMFLGGIVPDLLVFLASILSFAFTLPLVRSVPGVSTDQWFGEPTLPEADRAIVVRRGGAGKPNNNNLRRRQKKKDDDEDKEEDDEEE
jgi:hypothetical protein